MNGDGSNVIQLTHGDENNFLAGSIESPWSPDGSRLLVNRQTDSQNHQIYVIDVAGTNAILLTKDAGQYYSPMWSPNGEYIAFISDANDPSINRHLYIVDSQGNDLIDLTENLPQNERLSFADYYWSPDGNFITFSTDSQSGTYKSTVYKASLDGTRVQVTRTNQQILDWWNGITLQDDPPQKVDETSWSIMQADGSQTSLSTCKSNDRFLTYYAVKRSLDGNLFFGFNCTPSGWMLYGANQDGSNTHELISSPLDKKYDSLAQVTWSPDDHYLAFLALDGENIQLEDLYILNANDPSTQPMKMENSSSPSWRPIP
jgi:Tol biopolymer transport system component